MAFAAMMFVAAASIAFTSVGKSDISVEGMEASATTSFPIKLPADLTGERAVSFVLLLPPFYPQQYYIAVDDCLESLEINGKHIEDADIPFCDFSRGRTFDLTQYIKHGKNSVKMIMRNDGGDGMIDFKASANDFAFLLPLILFSIGIVSYGSSILFRRKAAAWTFGVFGVFITGVLIRIQYLIGTPYWVRGHDTDGHIEYVRHLLDQWAIPKIGEGWESWQPPLYYFLVAIPSGIAGMFGADAMTQTWIMQICALVASVACLWIAYVVGKMILDSKEQQGTLWIFMAVFAVFPGLVFFAARINNDVLTALLGFATVAFLLHWWKKNDVRSWIFLSVTIALSLLTKNTNLLLIPIAGACLLLHTKTPWKRKIQLGGISFLAILLISAWLPLYRSFTSGEQELIGNVGNLHSGLLLENKPYSYLTFNPQKVVTIPYNNAWSDNARRQQFPEYLYKSAFFGEFEFGNDRKTFASFLLFLSFIPLLLSLFGMIWSLRHRLHASLPHFIIIAILLLGHAAFRFQYPYSSSQDFRYSVVVLLPFAYFLCLGISHLKPTLLRHLATILTGVFLLSCAVFLVHLS